MKQIFFIGCSIFMLIFLGQGYAQPLLIDKIVAQVGDNIIMRSDIEVQYIQYKEQSQGPLPENFRCQLLNDLLAEKMMLIQAEKDSVVISEEEVEAELDKRFRYFISMMGSQEKLEEFYGKSIIQLKEEFRSDIKSQLLAQRMRSQIVGDVRVSPSEVREFFKQIPEDSLPYFNAEVQLAHIVIIPEASREQKEYAREKVEDLRERIINGEKLSDLALIYSEDPGSRDNGGDLGCIGRGELVPEFEAAAFKLEDGEVSEVVETDFGYHIIEMVERKGEKACLRHLLVQPKITRTNLNRAAATLDSIADLINRGKITFEQAVSRYSMDEFTNKSNGDIVNPQTGSTVFEIDQLESEVYYAIEDLSPGEISDPVAYQTQDGKPAYRLILLRSETEPHEANLKTDYSKIQAVTLNEKQNKLLTDWLMDKVRSSYLYIDPVFLECEMIKRWQESSEKISLGF